MRLVRVRNSTLLPGEVRCDRSITQDASNDGAPDFFGMLRFICAGEGLTPPAFLYMFTEVPGRPGITFVEEPADWTLEFAVLSQALELVVPTALFVADGDVLAIERIHGGVPRLPQLR